MPVGVSLQPPNEALGRTDRSLRRLLRQIQNAELGTSDGLGTEIRRARRQLRANHSLLAAARADGDGH